MPSKRPHIVLIQGDQLAANALAPYGNKVAKAPNIESLAASGVVFANAYCNSPLCAPSRASMMTGRLPSDIGVYDNAAELPSSTLTIAHHLRLAGYRTVLAGKMHFVGPDQLHGFEERLTTDIYPADFGWTPSWDGPDMVKDHLRNAMDDVRNAGVVETSLQLRYDESVAAAAVARIQDAAAPSTDAPLFLVASFTHPHDPFVITQEYWDRYDGVDIDMPTVGPLPHAERDPHSARLAEVLGFDDARLTADEVRRARRAYYGEISYLDDKVGQIIEALDDAGMLDNTVIVFTSDHGEMLGERGQWFKMSFFDGSARVPLIVSGVDVVPRKVDDVVSLVDLLPTLVALSGRHLESTTDLPGRSLLPLVADASYSADAGEAIGEYLGEAAVDPVVMIRRGRYKYIATLHEPAQLYDLDEDPNELHDLVGVDGYGSVEERFEQEASSRWDLRHLRESVVTSQTERKTAFEALTTGDYEAWDHTESTDTADRVVRNVRQSD